MSNEDGTGSSNPNFPYADGDFLPGDLDAVHELANDRDLFTYVEGLETGGFWVELAWLEQLSKDMETQYQICCAVAIASAQGKLKGLRLNIPPREDS